jgi:cytidine deaminase
MAMNVGQKEQLISLALQARKKAYAPYSGYQVGAALLCEDGSIYTGCNVENASYGATNCAERTAAFKAVSEGKRRFCAIAIAGGNAACSEENTGDYAYPCGICRQVLREFSNPGQMQVLICKSLTDYKTLTLEELLPESFGPENLQ